MRDAGRDSPKLILVDAMAQVDLDAIERIVERVDPPLRIGRMRLLLWDRFLKKPEDVV
jgi:hypothetical protein